MGIPATIWLFLVFGILGVFGEVLFTAGETLIKKRSLRLQGFSFVWMFPIYGLLAFLFEPISNLVAGAHWSFRGIIYMLGIYLVEYLSGAGLKKLIRQHVWHYIGKYNLHGHIQLAHAPVWFIVGLLVEYFYDDLALLSYAIAQHFS